VADDDFNVYAIAIDGGGALDETHGAEHPGPKPSGEPSHLAQEVNTACVGIEGKGIGWAEFRAPHHVEGVPGSDEIDDPVAIRVVDDRGREGPHLGEVHGATPNVDRAAVRKSARDDFESGWDFDPRVRNQNVELAQKWKERPQPAGPVPDMMQHTLEDDLRGIVY